MTKAVQLTSADTAAHNLYALILAKLGVIQLPQRADLGDVIFPDPVAQVKFLLPVNQAGNSGKNMSVQDQNGNEMSSLITGIEFDLGAANGPNIISTQAIKLQASASGMVIDVTVIVN